MHAEVFPERLFSEFELVFVVFSEIDVEMEIVLIKPSEMASLPVRVVDHHSPAVVFALRSFGIAEFIHKMREAG